MLHNLSGHLLFKSICFAHLRVKISVISAHLTAPQSIRVSSALPFHFPFTVGSLSPVTCTQAVARLVCSQPVTIAATGFTVVSPSSSLPALQVLGSSAFQSHLAAGTGEQRDWRFFRVWICPFCRICWCYYYYPHLFFLAWPSSSIGGYLVVACAECCVILVICFRSVRDYDLQDWDLNDQVGSK